MPLTIPTEARDRRKNMRNQRMAGRRWNHERADTVVEVVEKLVLVLAWGMGFANGKDMIVLLVQV